MGLGAVFVAGGTMTLGAIQAFIQYSQMFTQPVSQLGGMIAVVQSGTASAERVFDLLGADEQPLEPLPAAAPTSGDGTIEFENVTFSYDPDRPSIDDLSFDTAGESGQGRHQNRIHSSKLMKLRDADTLLAKTSSTKGAQHSSANP